MFFRLKKEITEESKDKIIKAAMKVFALYGFFKTPVAMIAKEAGVSKGLIFWYFRSKDELILEIAQRSLPLDVLDECLNRRLQGEDLLKCVGERYLNKYKDPSMRSLLLHTIAAGSMYPQIQEELRKMCASYTKKFALRVFGSDSVSARVKIRTFFGSLLCYSLRPPKDISRKEYLENLVRTILSS